MFFSEATQTLSVLLLVVTEEDFLSFSVVINYGMMVN